MESVLKVLTRLFLNNRFNTIYNSVTLSKMPFYAVAKGKAPGIFLSWPDCEAQVKGFSGAKYKKFNTITEAEQFIIVNSDTSKINRTSTKNLKRSYATTSNDNNYGNENGNQTNQKQKLNIVPQSVDYDKIDDSKNYNNIENRPFIPRKSAGYIENADDSDDSDDLNDILTKQMDDIEKRIKGVEKSVNKIIKKSTKDSQKQTIMIDPLVPKHKRKKNNLDGFEYNDDGFVQVYTDGACSANGTTAARAGLGVFWGEDHRLNLSEPVSGRATNNCGEIQAATRAIQIALKNGITHLQINTDSKFLINSITKWMPGNLILYLITTVIDL